MKRININNLLKKRLEKQNLKKFINIKANISYLQILILIISTFAFCYLIYDSTENVSAQTRGGSNFIPGYGCCKETKSGNICQYVPEADCNGSLGSPNLCENTVFCKPGCCFSKNTGICNDATPKISCDNAGGIWSTGSCNIQKCERACCILGSQAKFTTDKNCEIESGFLGVPVDFREDVQTEIECIFLTEKDDEGACVFESGEETTCLYITKEECISRTGNQNNFNKDTFCSSPELNTSCSPQNYDGCVDGKDSVYWYDSCGNKEDIKQNCSIFLGSICGKYRDELDQRPSQGEYVCRSLDCKADNGMNYKNGESWCEYEGTVGDGRDVVGSRHVKHICFMGEERIEPCADYRNQICVGTETNIGNGKTFSEAVCRQNNWQNCFLKDMIGESAINNNDNPDCIIRNVDLTKEDEDTFKFSLSVPKYPPGFDIKNNYDSALGICSLASQKCTIVEVKRFSGWECEINCHCDSERFTQQMNELCTSLGDCGGYVNTEGKYTNDGYTSRAGNIDGNQYKKYAQPERNLDMIDPGNLSELLGVYGMSASGGGRGGGGMGMLGYATLGAQGIQMLGMTQMLAEAPIIGSIGTALGGGQAAVEAAKTAAAGDAAKLSVASGAGWGNLLSAVGAGLAIATILSLGFGVKESTALTIGLAIGGALIIAANTGFMGITWQFVQVLGWIGFIVIILMWIFGIGKTKEKDINFQCLPWQPPTGGADCEKCNPKNEFDVPCSEYKCNSLGQACGFINPGTEDEKCINNCVGGISSPRISPMLENISEGYDYKEISDTGFAIKTDSGKCINEYTKVEYGIKTNKYAQCKIGTDPLQTYDEMNGGFFGEKNSYLLNHPNVMFMPSIAAFKNQYNLTQEQIESLGDIKFYIRCKESCDGLVNEVPYIIKSCVNPGPDITAPVIQKISPDSGAFVKYGETTKEIMLWVNEPANCRWDITDIDYNNMANEMTCKTGINKYQLYGWPCNTTLTGVNNNSKFYIRCKDQPWLAETNTSRNKMTQSQPYELSVSSSPLSIIDLKPENGYEFIKGTEPVEINLNVRTSGGAEDGKAICEWKLEGFSFDRLEETNSDYHSGVWNTGFRGEHIIEYYCEDIAGNNASASTSFKIKIDTAGPKIIRVYFDNALKIITDEQAECRYGFNRNFKFENSTEMNGDGFEHFADWQLKTYYIQCEDQFKRKGSKTIVKAYELL